MTRGANAEGVDHSQPGVSGAAKPRRATPGCNTPTRKSPKPRRGSPSKVEIHGHSRVARSLAVETWPPFLYFDFLAGGFLGPRGCFW